MICPKCGFEQPDNAECLRCGVIVSRYKGPVLGGAAPRPAAATPAPFPPPPAAPIRTGAAPPAPSMAAAETLYGGPEPALAAAGGTLYDGPAPAAAGGGTVYSGTMHDGPRAGRTGGGRAVAKGSFGAGKVLGESFSIYFKNFLPFVLLTALALSPNYLAQAFVGAAPEASALTIVPLLLFLVSTILCPYIATSAVTYGVFQQMRGRDASIGDCFARGLSSLFRVLGLAIVQGLRIMLGFVLCVVPGVIWTLQLAVSIPAAVEEGTGIGESMERSTFLTDGFRGEIFSVLASIGFLNVGSTFALALTAAKDESLAILLIGIKDLLFVGLSATATAVMYYRLRSVKESIDVDQIASVFA